MLRIEHDMEHDLYLVVDAEGELVAEPFDTLHEAQAFLEEIAMRMARRGGGINIYD